MTPNELIRVILRAPVDLLWNGGIGTYVKAAGETDAEVGDRANDPVRVNGREVRARVVGEGGNLGFTQRGRIEYARHGGRINTDFIDNSAGVDTSDHEVNIKILLGLAIQRGELIMEDRNDPARGVRGRHRRSRAVRQLPAGADPLAGDGGQLAADRELRGSDAAARSRRRRTRPRGRVPALERGDAASVAPTDEELARPELAVLLAYAKRSVARRCCARTCRMSPYLSQDLRATSRPRSSSGSGT